MIKCDPQPVEMSKMAYYIYKGNNIYHFDYTGKDKVYAPIDVTPDAKTPWELRKVDNIWYWIQE